MSLLPSLRRALGNVSLWLQTLLTSLDWLSIATPKKTWISQQMEADMNPVFNYVSLYLFPLTEGTPFVHLELFR
jgi:hypothetical protein